MKKVIVVLICLFAMPAMAEQTELPCNGGSTITAKDGTKFCKSDKGMNWWSAFAWCESQGQGRKLADFSKMCPGVSQASANTAGDCPNLQGVSDEDVWLWSSLASSTSWSVVVNASSGAVNALNRDYAANRRALCE